MSSAKKVAIITGASQGIGAGLAEAYRKRGYAVAAAARSMPGSDDPDVLAVSGDLAVPGTGADIVERAVRRFGRLDTVVNNAGIYLEKPFTEYTDADYDLITGVNLRGFFDVTRAAIPAMLAGGNGGHILCISTSLVERANARIPAALTALTKGGLVAAIKELAIEYAARRIRANAVSLGVVRTPMHPEDPGGALAAQHPLGRMAEIDDVVEAILYLEQATFVTGDVLHVDGGQSAGF
ncbi:SDR family oxidoreductase [Actinospica sp. MGRD01-02]|uniref:SDR family oxidoreductase n=1 Tax=Actinospica acidithermotolerans TaxID=2828514 RepID=A0A941IFA7_9ACTN|nr:SDR family oxidoreductase [Actinospica acidithermotolerans]MBR7826125.1 SDR family oxidoreductase [Actinospica acidithermotolerans]